MALRIPLPAISTVPQTQIKTQTTSTMERITPQEITITTMTRMNLATIKHIDKEKKKENDGYEKPRLLNNKIIIDL